MVPERDDIGTPRRSDKGSVRDHFAADLTLFMVNFAEMEPVNNSLLPRDRTSSGGPFDRDMRQILAILHCGDQYGGAKIPEEAFLPYMGLFRPQAHRPPRQSHALI